jgi:hypothetical protein
MSDHWNKLANELGTPSLDPVQKKSTSESSPASAPVAKPIAAEVAPESAKATKPAKKSSWDSITEFFGISSRSRDVEEAVVEKVEAPPVVAEAEPVRAPQARREPAAKAPRNERGNRPAAPQDNRRNKPNKPSMWTADSPEPKVEAAVEPEVLERDEPVVSFRPEPIERDVELDAEVVPENVQRRGRRRRSRRGRSMEGSGRGESLPPRETVEPVAAPRNFTPDFDDDHEDLEEVAEGPKEVWPKPDADESERPPRRRRRRRRGARSERVEGAVHPAEVGDGEEPHFDDAGDADEPGSRREGHIKVPTWAEAMSFLVESNMLNHQKTPAQSRRRSSPPRRRDA